MPGRRAGSHRAAQRALWTALALLLTAAFAAAPARAGTVVSLTFDDGQATQYAAKTVLASRGVQGTFYLNSAKVEANDFYMTWPQVAALAADGHEIGGHTLTHANLADLSDSQKRTEVCQDRQKLIARGYDPVSFAYPYGYGDESAQAVVDDCGYTSARRVGGIASPNWCPECGSPHAESLPAANPFLVRAPAFGSGEITLAAVQSVITQAEFSGGGWVPLVFHGVCESGDCGEGWVRPSTLSALLDWLEPRAGHGTVLRTVREAVEHEPPDTAIDSKPSATTEERTASFTFSSSPAGATFDCSLDGDDWSPCESPVSYAGLGLGEHSFRVRARDELGAVDPSPATWTWTVEADPADPTPTVVSLTFDDAQATQYASKGPLDEHDMGGTFYANSDSVCLTDCSGSWTMSWLQLQALAADGNEIGGHTLDHIDLTDPSIPTAEKRRQICEDRENLIARGFDAISFAYPYSHHDATARALVEECGYTSGRGVGGAPAAGETIPPLDPFGMRTPGHSSGEITLSAMQQEVRDAEEAGGGWVQLVFHGICETRCGDGWVKPSSFDALLDWLEPRAADGTVVRTVGDMMGGAPPNTTIDSGPKALTNDSTASFTLSSNRTAPTFECSLDGEDWAPCTDAPSYSGLGDGPHTFRARARDELDVVDPSPASWAWTVDTAPPDTSIDGGPTGLVAADAASFGLSASEAGASFECKLDDGSYTACTSPVDYSGLGDGEHTFRVRAVDAAGNEDPSPATRTWTVDTAPPDTSITAGPEGLVASDAAEFVFSATGGGVSFECKLDDGAYAACTSPVDLLGLDEGEHTFRVRAVDAAGNDDPTPASRTWTVDTRPPDTSIDGGPSGLVASDAAEFLFSATGGGVSFECKLDDGTYEACTSPVDYPGLDEGEHTFSVRAVDAAGNDDLSPATWTWTVDTAPPDTSITGGGPSGVVDSTSASFGLSASEPGSSFECSFDDGEWESCTSPQERSDLVDGDYSFRARARDAAGNVDASPAERTWTVDTTAPDTWITSGPSDLVASASATFRFDGSAGSSFECKLDDGEWEACTSPHELSGLGDGEHTFWVRAVDAAGNDDPLPATRKWTVDTTAPGTSITTGPEGTVSSDEAEFLFAAADGGVSFECKLDDGAYTACSSPEPYSNLGDGEHTFSVRAIDAAGNDDPTPATRTWTVDTTPPATSISDGPEGTVASQSAQFAFDGGATFDCRLDGGDWEPCVSPKSYSDLDYGQHAFEVRGKDAAGNASSASRTWTIEAPPPPPPTPATDQAPAPPPPPYTPPELDNPPAPQQAPAGEDVPVEKDEERPPADAEEPPDAEPESRPARVWSPRQIRRILRATARANKRKKLRKLVRRGVLKVKVPRRRRGPLRIEANLLPDPPGPAIRLGRKRVGTSSAARRSKLRLTRSGRKRLARLWVAAIEFRVTYRAVAGDEIVTARRVVLVRR